MSPGLKTQLPAHQDLPRATKYDCSAETCWKTQLKPSIGVFLAGLKLSHWVFKMVDHCSTCWWVLG